MTMMPPSSWRGGIIFVYYIFVVCLCLSMISAVAVMAKDTDDDANVDDDATEYFFANQIVDHLDPINNANRTWTQRYYMSDKYFGGPGSPIFIILGGEGEIRPSTGLFYPFVTEHLAKQFNAYVFEPEHRFYGKSQPIQPINEDHSRDGYSGSNLRRSNVGKIKEDPRVQLFTPEQAVYDAVTMLKKIRNDLGCSDERQQEAYCPVITVGGSYPGFLSAFSRIMFPDIVDMAYAASAPMLFYAQTISSQYDYYNHITKVAEATITGCSKAVRSALEDVNDVILNGPQHDLHETELGICPSTVPDYITDNQNDCAKCLRKTMAEEVMMVIGYTFANDNMANYPPTSETRLYKACETFLDPKSTSFDKVRKFLLERLPSRSLAEDDEDEIHFNGDDANSSEGCWSMELQLPSGNNARISGGDWSGDGTGRNGESWDFQTCSLLVEAIGFEGHGYSMFPRRDWSILWLTKHCQSRFGITPRPYELVHKWKFDDLVGQNVTRIIFTNGLNDGWSVGGIHTNLSESLIALDFPNGAHHSDLSHVGPSSSDTVDITKGFKSITKILGGWLKEVKSMQTTATAKVIQ